MAHRSKMPPIPSETHSKVRSKKVKQKDKHLHPYSDPLVKEKSLKLDMRLKYEFRPKAFFFK